MVVFSQSLTFTISSSTHFSFFLIPCTSTGKLTNNDQMCDYGFDKEIYIISSLSFQFTRQVCSPPQVFPQIAARMTSPSTSLRAAPLHSHLNHLTTATPTTNGSVLHEHGVTTTTRIPNRSGTIFVPAKPCRGVTRKQTAGKEFAVHLHSFVC